MLIVLCFVAVAQTDNDFEKFKNEYYKGINDLREDYQKFVEKSDKEFADYLRKDWEQFQLFKAEYAESMPGPAAIPVYKKLVNIEPLRRIQPTQISYHIKTEEISAKPRNPIPLMNEPLAEVRSSQLCFDFFGTPVCVFMPSEMRAKFTAPLKEQNFASYWEKLSDSEFDAVVVDLLRIKNQLILNDYALYLLVSDVSFRATNDKNSSTLLSWFLLTKLGYKVKLGYHSKGVSLLVPVVNQLYGFSFYTFNGIKYYLLDGTTGSVFTYENDYSAANQIMNFNLYKTPSFQVDTLARSIAFSYDSKNYNIKVLYNKNLIDFYRNYPQCYIGVYFDAGVSDITRESLEASLWPVLRNMPEKDAAGLLLKMVQTGFAYETDQEQFGKEKYFFPEEILHYKASDCEDRSVFFAFVVNELLDLPVISLNYPLHVATAICFKSLINGDMVQYGDNQYTVCDPTYINAPVGASMPQFKKSKFSIISPLKRSHDEEQAEFVWEKIYNAGGTKSSCFKSYLIFKDSSCVVAGIFTDSLKLADKKWKTDPDKTGVFIASFDKNNRPQWVTTFFADGIVSAEGIIADAEQNTYITGEFGKTLYFEKRELSSSSSADQFVVKLNRSGKIEWETRIPLDSMNHSKPFIMQAQLSSSGEILGFTLIEEYTFDNNQVIYFSEENNLTVITERGTSESGFSFSPELGAAGNYELLEVWKKLTDKYISMHYDKSIAGFFALMETLQNASIDITGKEMMACLNTLNPAFKNTYKNFYLSLQFLTRISSRNGIVTFYTTGGQVLKCGPLSITSGSRAQMRDYKSGNKQVKIMNGIYYDTFFRSLKVNYLKCFKVNGDIMIDYDTEHYQKVVNTQKDILKQ